MSYKALQKRLRRLDKMSKHPQDKHLKKLQPIIEKRLQETGANSNTQIRKLANELGIDAGLVIKTKNAMNFRNMMVPKAPEVIEQAESPEIIDTTIEVVSESVGEEAEVKEKLMEEEKKERKERVSLTPALEIEMCGSYARGEFTQIELAEIYGISRSSVSRIINKHEVGKETNMGKSRKKMTRSRQRNNKENIAAKKAAVLNNTEIIPEDNDERLYPEEGGRNPNAPFVTVKFVTHFPIFSREITSKDIIWAVSKNGDFRDLREDVKIMEKDKSGVINDFRGRYYLISISNNDIHLIDYWDETNKTLVLYTNKEKYKFRGEDGSHITYDDLNEFIKATMKYDATVNRSRLKPNDFMFDPMKFTDLHKVFGLDKFSFNVASKSNCITVEAGLIAERHDGMPVDKFIYDASFDEVLMFNYAEQERIARKFLTDNFDFSDETKIKQLKLYVTGLQSAYSTVIRVCYELGVNLVAMHYNAKTRSYVPQYVNGCIEDTGAYIKGFEKLYNQKNLNSEILLFNCTYEDFKETNVDKFYVMEMAKMRNQSPTDNQKAESIIVIIKNVEDIWKIYPSAVDYITANSGLNLAVWVTDAKIKDNIMYWGMNIVKSFNYK